VGCGAEHGADDIALGPQSGGWGVGLNTEQITCKLALGPQSGG